MAQQEHLEVWPVRVNPTVDKLSDVSYTFKLVSSTGDDLDLTGYTALMELRPYVRAKRVFDTLTTENGRIEINQNAVVITFPASVTAEYKFDEAVYDLLVVSPLGLRHRIVEGSIDFNDGVTR